MTLTVKAMASQRWICRTHLLPFMGTSSEDGNPGSRRPAGRDVQAVTLIAAR
jgi:hypothetical protein